MRYIFLRFPEGRERAVTLSYDDGLKSDLRLIEIMNKNGLKGTFNLCSSFIGDSAHDRLDRDDIEKHILANGHEIAVHGKVHRASGKQRAVDGIRDILDCRLELEKMFGIIVRGMAYPDSGILSFINGNSFETVRTYLKDLDIAYSRTLGGDNSGFELPADWYAWMPTAHHDNPDIDAYITKFNDYKASYIANATPKLFYLWGHSFEFDRNSNWEHMEDICARLGGQKDVWYATNGEIYNYVQAFNSIVRSADGSIMYNPTLITLWVWVDCKVYKIEPGETVRIE